LTMETELIRAVIEDSSLSVDESQETIREKIKIVVFSAGTSLYALPAADIQEIMLDLQLHYLPFMPPFIRGLVNRLGEPLTVVDLVNLFSGGQLDGRAFMILKPSISKMAILIDSVKDILEASLDELKPLPPTGNPVDLFVQSVMRKKTEDVMILNLHEILSAVRRGIHAVS